MATRRAVIGGGLGLILGSGSVGRFVLASEFGRCVTKPPAVIDAHCHIFNASDLQVQGFIKQVVARSGWARFLRPIAEPLQRFGWREAPKARAEIERLRSTEFSAGLFATSMEREESETADLLEGFFKMLKRDNPASLDAWLTGIEQEDADDPGRSTTALLGAQRAALTNRETILDLLLGRGPESHGVASRVALALAPFFRWRYLNARCLLETYGCAEEAGMHACVPALVDYDLFVGKTNTPTPSSIADQVELMAVLQQMSNGRVAALAPFNPWRASEDDGYLQMTLRALSARTVLGVKLYPPIGFKPVGNDELAGNRGKGWDEALWALYEACAKERSVLMTHANASNGVSDASDLNAAADNWRPVLSAFGGLKLSLGHLGIGKKSQKQKWPKAFTALMEDFKDQVYGDLSYHDAVLDRRYDGSRDQMAKLYLRHKSSAVRKQTMFGTDWSIIAKEPRHHDYLKRFRQGLAEAGVDAETVSGFFGGNAKAFFGHDFSGPLSFSRA